MNKRLLFTIPSYEYMRASLVAAGDFELGRIERKIFPDGERYLRLAADRRGGTWCSSEVRRATSTRSRAVPPEPPESPAPTEPLEPSAPASTVLLEQL
jgi:hypothetical protein